MGVTMKKIINCGLLLITVLSLTACSNNNKQSSQTHKSDTTKVTKKKNTHKKKQKKVTKKKTPEKQNTDSSNTKQPTTNLQQNNQPTQQATQQQPNSNQQNSNISYDENTLTGFINKYGMSPAAYKSEHDGMSAYDALKSTPEYMETFGEKQTESMMDRGLMDHNGNMTDKGTQWENHADDQSDQNYDTEY